MIFITVGIWLRLFSLQGYDDIPKEIPDPDAKKVHILLIP
jgi:hypothetical protein